MKLLYQQFWNLLVSQRDRIGPRFEALSKYRWSRVFACEKDRTGIKVPEWLKFSNLCFRPFHHGMLLNGATRRSLNGLCCCRSEPYLSGHSRKDVILSPAACDIEACQGSSLLRESHGSPTRPVHLWSSSCVTFSAFGPSVLCNDAYLYRERERRINFKSFH